MKVKRTLGNNEAGGSTGYIGTHFLAILPIHVNIGQALPCLDLLKMTGVLSFAVHVFLEIPLLVVVV